MAESLVGAIKAVCKAFGNERTRLMDIVRAVQAKYGHVSDEALDLIAEATKSHRVEVESVVTFYAFYSKVPKGRVVIRLCNDPIDRMHGGEAVAQALRDELGIGFGQTTKDGRFTLEHAPCIGMCDQAPGALVNDVVVTKLTAEGARAMVSKLKADPDPTKLVTTTGDGQNAHALVHAMVRNNLLKRGEVIFATDHRDGEGLKKALELKPEDVIEAVKKSRLRGRGGAGFPTGLKWTFTRGAKGAERWVLCNGDEGEPGTFKDRVIFTECPDLMFEGMTVAGWAIGARNGILYLRGEYAYLQPLLEDVLAQRRARHLLGSKILGKDFSFDIRIQLGAGAYICGEETSLISSCEGRRGDPMTRPPFPAEKGYLGHPTTVNNVETFCCVTRIMEKGAEWFGGLGCKDSSGTKLFSVSGDCTRPGVYELPFGTKVSELLKEAGAVRPAFCVVGGPSGRFIGPKDFEKALSYDSLATGGAFMVFDESRDVLQVVEDYLEFFVDESCGYCTPCRVGNVLLKERVERIRHGRGEPQDLVELESICKTVKTCSRCGLGQTSPQPVLTTLENFRPLYEARVKVAEHGFQRSFDLAEAVHEAENIAHRTSVHAHHE